VSGAFVKTNRLLFALAYDAGDSTRDAARRGRTANRASTCAAQRRWTTNRASTCTAQRRRTTNRASTACRCLRSGLRTRRLTSSDSAGRRDLSGLRRALGPSHEVEIVTGNGILVFLAQEVPLHEGIHVGRQHARTGSPLEQPDRTCILLPAKDQFFFLFAPGRLFPDRHGSGHENRHDAQRHEQRRHRVAGFAGRDNVLTS